jgi:hypothetical protein
MTPFETNVRAANSLEGVALSAKAIQEEELPNFDIAGALAELDVYAHRHALEQLSEAMEAHQKTAAATLLRVGKPGTPFATAEFNLDPSKSSATELRAETRLLREALASDINRSRVLVTITTQRRALSPLKRGLRTAEECPFEIFRSDGYAGFKPKHSLDVEAWAREIEDAIRVALSAGAHIVSLGEFDFPPGTTDELEVFSKRITTILDQITDRPVFVFAGSYHDWAKVGCRNLGMIFVNRLIRGENPSPVQHEKMISAKTLGEVLTPRPQPTLVTYRLPNPLGKMTILICVDAFDSTVIDALEARSRMSNDDRVDLILVPSYNPSPRLFWSCQILSYRAKCVVVYVNSLGQQDWDTDSGRSCIKYGGHRGAEIFISGVPFKTWKEQVKEIKTLAAQNPRALKALALPKFEGEAGLQGLHDMALRTHAEPLDDHKLPFLIQKWVFPNEFPYKAHEHIEKNSPAATVRIHKCVKRWHLDLAALTAASLQSAQGVR